VVLLVSAAAAWAHDLYLRPQTYRPAAGQTVRVEFHNGDKFPASEVPVKIERLRDAAVRTAAGARAFTDLRIEDTATVGDFEAPHAPGPFVLAGRTIPNFIELDAAKFEDYLQHEGLGAVVEWRRANGEAAKPGREHYSKYVKALGYVGAADGAFDQPAGLTLEFVPLKNPYTLAPGERLPVRVLFRGQPKAGQAIALAHAAPGGEVRKQTLGRTDERGEILVPVHGAGLWKLHTIVMERKAERAQADWESFWASFTFELPVAALSRR